MRAASAVVVAGGSGRRLGADTPKQYLEIGGRPILLRATEPLLEHPGVFEVVVVLPRADAGDPPAWLTGLGVRVVAGGETRADSVWNGLQATTVDARTVLIHDAARPFVGADLIDRVLAAAHPNGAIPCIRVADTIKEVDSGMRIVATPDRSRLWQAQTPQAFPRQLVLAAHERARAAGVSGTDDAELVERMGVRVAVVEGAAENLKVTRPVDLLVAEALASQLLEG